jgi:hypothetical protein
MAVHFVGFRDDRFWSAVRVFGQPDFVHRNWDARARFGGEFHPADTVVFAQGTDADPPSRFTFDDSSVF